jgi:hypothetical protein
MSKTTYPELLGEETPLLRDENLSGDADQARVSFRRPLKPLRPIGDKNQRSSVRGSLAAPLFPSEDDFVLSEERGEHVDHLGPLDALAPLVAGGMIVSTTGYRTPARPPSVVKSLPAFAPFPRKERHRSFYLQWINEFRHWWKSR